MNIAIWDCRGHCSIAFACWRLAPPPVADVRSRPPGRRAGGTAALPWPQAADLGHGPRNCSGSDSMPADTQASLQNGLHNSNLASLCSCKFEAGLPGRRLLPHFQAAWQRRFASPRQDRRRGHAARPRACGRFLPVESSLAASFQNRARESDVGPALRRRARGCALPGASRRGRRHGGLGLLQDAPGRGDPASVPSLPGIGEKEPLFQARGAFSPRAVGASGAWAATARGLGRCVALRRHVRAVQLLHLFQQRIEIPQFVISHFRSRSLHLGLPLPAAGLSSRGGERVPCDGPCAMGHALVPSLVDVHDLRACGDPTCWCES